MAESLLAALTTPQSQMPSGTPALWFHLDASHDAKVEKIMAVITGKGCPGAEPAVNGGLLMVKVQLGRVDLTTLVDAVAAAGFTGSAHRGEQYYVLKVGTAAAHTIAHLVWFPDDPDDDVAVTKVSMRERDALLALLDGADDRWLPAAVQTLSAALR